MQHIYIKPRSPQLNGKVERSHRTDQQEFYQLLTYTNDVDLNIKLNITLFLNKKINREFLHNGQGNRSISVWVILTQSVGEKSLHQTQRALTSVCEDQF